MYNFHHAASPDDFGEVNEDLFVKIGVIGG